MILTFANHSPQIAEGVFIAPDAKVIGQVSLEKNVSIFFSAVLRGDIEAIHIGEGSNVQEHGMIHTSSGRQSAYVGKHVTVGHRAIIHGCRIGDNCLIGMGAIVLDDTVIEEDCLIGAGTLLSENKRIPAKSLVLGSPGKVVRTLSEEDLRQMRKGTSQYVELGVKYSALLGRGW